MKLNSSQSFWKLIYAGLVVFAALSDYFNYGNDEVLDQLINGENPYFQTGCDIGTVWIESIQPMRTTNINGNLYLYKEEGPVLIKVPLHFIERISTATSTSEDEVQSRAAKMFLAQISSLDRHEFPASIYSLGPSDYEINKLRQKRAKSHPFAEEYVKSEVYQLEMLRAHAFGAIKASLGSESASIEVHGKKLEKYYRIVFRGKATNGLFPLSYEYFSPAGEFLSAFCSFWPVGSEYPK